MISWDSMSITPDPGSYSGESTKSQLPRPQNPPFSPNSEASGTPESDLRPPDVAYRLARWTLAAFLTTFILARILVILIMSHSIPDLYLHVGGNHVHHLNYGIFLLSGIGGYLVFFHPSGPRLSAAAAVYGIGLALTFDEFGMWLHLGGPYWQRASFDAIVVIAALLGLIAVAPDLKKFHTAHWWTTALVVVLTLTFAYYCIRSVRAFGNRLAPTFQRLESEQPE